METTSPDSFSGLYELMEYFDSEQKCLDYLTESLYGNNITCPHCNHEKVYKFSDNVRFKCASCRKQFTAKAGTIFEDSKIPLRKWFMAIYLIVSHKKGISSHQLARDLKVTQKTGWFMLMRIRHAILQGSFEKPLEGVIECDETFIGGKNKNRHADKKVKNSQGRSFKDKTPVMGIIEREIAEVVPRPNKNNPEKIVNEKVVSKESFLYGVTIPNTQEASIRPIIEERVKKGSIVYTDEWWAYRNLCENYNHEFVNHAAKQYVDGEAYTNTLEGFWSLFKRSILGIYHSVSPEHLQRYIDEAVFRYNTRKDNDGNRVSLFLTKLNEGSLKYKQLIHDKKN